MLLTINPPIGLTQLLAGLIIHRLQMNCAEMIRLRWAGLIIHRDQVSCAEMTIDTCTNDLI